MIPHSVEGKLRSTCFFRGAVCWRPFEIVPGSGGHELVSGKVKAIDMSGTGVFSRQREAASGSAKQVSKTSSAIKQAGAIRTRPGRRRSARPNQKGSNRYLPLPDSYCVVDRFIYLYLLKEP